MIDRLEALEQLGRLRDQKVLTEAEFEAEKARLLAQADSPPQSAPAAAPLPLMDTAAPPPARDLFAKPSTWIVIAALLATAIGGYIGLSSTTIMKKTKDGDKAGAQPGSSDSADPAARLSAILKFDKPGECAPANDLAAAFADLRALEPATATKSVTIGLNGPSFAADVLRAQQGNATIARMVVSGTLEGLRVNELRTTRFDGSDAEVIQIRFSESPDRVRGRLNEAGFSIAKPNELKTVDLEGGRGLAYGVESVTGGAALTCIRQ